MSRSSRYKPLIRRKRRKITSEDIESKLKEKLPKINPSVREIWKILSDGRLFFKNKELERIEDKELDFRQLEGSLIQSDDYTYEEIMDMERFLASLISLAKSKHIKIIIPLKIMTKEEYDQIKEEEW
jgi:hypothetical protein